MAEATIKDLIKEIRVSNNMTTRIEEATLGATESVQRSIADLNTMLGKYFLAQNASRGDDLEAQREAKRNAKMKSGPTQAPAAATAGGGGGLSNFLQGLGGLSETAMFAGLGGAAGGAALTSAIRGRFLKGLARAPFVGAAALFSEEIITTVFKGLTGKDIPTEDLAKFEDALNKTLLGSFLGPKGAFAGFMNSVITQTLEKQFPNKDDDESAWQQKTKLLGIELPFTNEDFAIWGGTIGSFFVPSLVTGAIRKSLGIGGDAAADGAKNTNNAAKKSFLKGFKPNMNIVRGGLRFAGWAGFAGLAGYTLVQAIEGIASDGTADATDLLNLGISAASTMSMIGMFGSTGLLMTGIVGLAIGGGYLLYDYLQKRQAKLNAEFEEAVAKRQAEIEGSGMSEMDALSSLKINATVAGTRQRISRAERRDAKIEEEALIAAFAEQGVDLEAKLAEQIANANQAVFFKELNTQRGKKIQLYNAEGKPVTKKSIKYDTSGLLPYSSFDAGGMSELEGAVIDQLSQSVGNELFQSQLENFLNVYREVSGESRKTLFGQAQIKRNANVSKDLMPPDLSGYSGGVGVLDMKDQSTNSSYTYAAGTDRIDPRDKALID